MLLIKACSISSAHKNEIGSDSSSLQKHENVSTEKFYIYLTKYNSLNLNSQQ